MFNRTFLSTGNEYRIKFASIFSGKPRQMKHAIYVRKSEMDYTLVTDAMYYRDHDRAI